jgi:hypothetical protein
MDRYFLQAGTFCSTYRRTCSCTICRAYQANLARTMGAFSYVT